MSRSVETSYEDLVKLQYLCINKNIEEKVNFINFVSEFESVCFDRSCQNKSF